MSSILRSLIWKEWHERKRMLAVGLSWLLCGAVYAICYELARHYRAPVASYYTTCLMYGLIVPVFLAMRTALGEATQGTLAFTSALPISLKRTAAARLLSAAVTLVLPMLAGAIVMSIAVGSGLVEQVPRRPLAPESYVQLPNRESLSSLAAVGLLWKVTAVAAAHGVTLLFVLATIGARRRSEAVVGLIAAPIIMLWFLGTGIRVGEFEGAWWANGIGAFLPHSLAINYGYGDEVGQYTDLGIARFIWLPLAVNLLVLTGLGTWFAHRYGSRSASRTPNSERRRWYWPRLLRGAPNPIPGRIAALTWADLQQALPLAGAGLLLAIVMTFAGLVLDRGSLHGGFALSIAGQLPGSTWIIATLWATVVAAGVFGPELHPRVEEFWRSRPVSPSTWFWTKYLVGLLAVLIVLDGVTILVSWNSPYADGNNRMSIAYIACMPLIHALTYSLAVACVVWLRRPVGGAMAAIVLFFMTMLIAGSFPALIPYEPITVYNDFYFSSVEGLPYVIDAKNPVDDGRYFMTYGTLTAIVIASTVFAWRTVQAPPRSTGMLIRRWRLARS